MDPKILELLERLADLDNKEIGELENLLVKEFDRLDKEPKSASTVDSMAEVAEATDRVRGERGQRAAAAAEAEQRAEELRRKMHPTDEDLPPEGEGEGGSEGESESEGEGEEQVPFEGVAAAAATPARPSPGAARRTAPPPRPKGLAVGGARLIAQRPHAGTQVGDEIDRKRLSEIMMERINNAARGGVHSPEPVVCASLRWNLPDERRLGSDPLVNWEKIDAVTNLEAIRASGGICGPVNMDYSVFVSSVADRPIRDALPSFQASRGGLRFVAPPTFTSVGASGTAVWTEATDAGSPANSAVKPVQRILCTGEQVAYVDGVATRLEFGLMQGRFFPELIAANTELALANAARVAELNLLAKIQTNSTTVSSGQLLGASRDLLATIDQACAAYRYRSRLNEKTQLRVIMPLWALDMIRADLTREIGHGQSADWNSMALSLEDIQSIFAARNINITFSLDGQVGATVENITYTLQGFGAQASGAPLLDWPQTLVWQVFAEGTFQFLDGGEINIGVVYDSTLLATNDYQTFIEPLEGLAMRGWESLQVVSSVRPNGGSAGTINTTTY